MVLSNKNLIIDYDNGSYVYYNHEIYELDKISFTTPSSHKLNGSSYPMEAHLYHRSSNSGKILVLGVFLDVNSAISKSKMFFDKFEASIPRRKGDQRTVNMPEEWNVYQILPGNKAFFLYEGSIPRHPCTEGVIWIVFEEAVNCSENFFDVMKKISKKTARPIQKLNDRAIYYNTNTSSKTNKNYGNKLRCYTEKEFKKTCAKLVGNKDVEKYRAWKTTMISITVVVLVVFTLFILWLIDKGLITNVFTSLHSKFNTAVTGKVVHQ
jgi:hypothetical protein